MNREHEWPPPSTPNLLHTHMEKVFAECVEISRAKNADYASNEDPFNNFRMVEHLGVCPVATGIVVRLSDKFSRLSRMVCSSSEPAVKDESVRDTIRDAINYLAILDAWLAQQMDTQSHAFT